MRTLAVIAIRNILKQWRYSLGAFFTVVTAFIALCLFRAYMLDVGNLYEENFQYRGMFGHLIVEKDGAEGEAWDKLLLEKEQKFLGEWLASRKGEVAEVVRFLVASGMISNGRSSTVFLARGYDLEAGARLRGSSWAWDTAAGKPLHLAEGVALPLVIGKSLAAILECETTPVRLFSKAGGYSPEERPFHCPELSLQLSVTTPAGQSNALDGTMVGIIDGIFKEVDSKIVNLPLPAMQRLYDTKGLSYLTLELKDSARVSAFRDALAADARAKGISLKVTRWQDHREGDLYLRTMELLSIFRNFVVAILVGITGLSVFNTFLKVVHERTREIGTLRSLGFRRREVTGIFFIEAFLLSAGGVGAGVLVSVGVSWAINTLSVLYKAGIVAEPVPFRVAYDPAIYLTSGTFLVVIASLAALGAVVQAIRRQVAENLIHA